MTIDLPRKRNSCYVLLLRLSIQRLLFKHFDSTDSEGPQISDMTFLLIVVVAAGFLLLATIESIHCPYWQLPLGLSFLFGSVMISIVAPFNWSDVALGWGGGIGLFLVCQVIIATIRG